MGQDDGHRKVKIEMWIHNQEACGGGGQDTKKSVHAEAA